MVKWEYESIIHDGLIDGFLGEMQRMGEQGWELVVVIPETEYNYRIGYFKRIKQEHSNEAQ